MKLDLVKKLVFALVIGITAVSCMDDSDNDYTPPTLEEEMDYLNEYIDTLQNRGFDIDTTDLGVYYVIDSIGDGEFPTFGDTLDVNYTGFFLSGDVFDHSGGNPYEVILGETSVIEGWTDGLQKFNKGGRGYLIIPSEYGYGSTGYGSIPPFTTIVFNITLEDIKFAN